MTQAIFIGIDPGVSGAVAIILPGECLVFDTPVGKAQVGQEYLPAEMAAILRPYTGAVAVLEQVAAPRAMRGNQAGNITASGGLKIGFGAGLWVGVLATLKIAYERPTPQQWRKVLGLPNGADKDISRQRAQALFPSMVPQLSRKKDHGRAEALLLAEYARRRWQGKEIQTHPTPTAERAATPRGRVVG
jgi:crossover junction endodeoxyribonuclease RuvC